jgi:NAD(P)-dependent dehydrogenase (short-subunit alcohol dehydrogenase family)
MVDLSGKVCIVTGASRGVGRGVALGLLEAGATVYISARTVKEGSHPLDRPGSLESVAAEATALPGRLVAHRVDHASDAETEAFVRRVIDAEGRLDVLVNNAWPGYEKMEEEVEPGRNPFTWVDPIWLQPMWRFDAMIGVGLRAAWCATRIAAGRMAEQRHGLIVNISFWAAQKFMGNPIYGVAKAAADKLAADVATAMREYGVAAVSLYPGLVRTELVLLNAQHFDMTNSESPQFIGRAVAHLAADPAIMEKSGQVLVAASLALEYGFTDIDGRQPQPATLATP